VSVARPRTKKPNAVDETARVLKVYDWLREELRRRESWALDGDILQVAERIAARTEEEHGNRA
jgi:hypothetical protein